MVKQVMITIRVDRDTKSRIEAAASVKGQSMTTFIVEAAERAARKARPPKGQFGGVPSYFRGCCMEATQGGTMGYFSPAWHLTIHLDTSMPYDMDEDDWADELAQLREHSRERNDDCVWQWFHEHYPKCMALVPKRRKEQFLKGVYEAIDEGRW